MDTDCNGDLILEEDDQCPEAGCNGVLEVSRGENCTCHIDPPCGSCVSAPLVCNVCGATDGEFYSNLLKGWNTQIRQQNKAIRRKNKLIHRLRSELSREPACSIDWTTEPPAESGDYWWWNGDENGPPILVSIGLSYNAGTPRLFAEPGQHGWNRYQWADEMGGHWMVATIPDPPKRSASVDDGHGKANRADIDELSAR